MYLIRVRNILNNCLLKEIDVEGGKGFLSKRCDELADIVASFHLVDAFRVLYPDKQDFTFYRPGCSPSRLDRIYVSSSMSVDVTSAEHVASLSDHFGLKLRIKLKLVTSPVIKDFTTSFWKLNCAILEDEEFLGSFQLFWNDILKSSPSFSDIAEWWDQCAKPSIKCFCIAFSARRKDR